VTLTADTMDREMAQTFAALTWAKAHCCWWLERECALACLALRWGRFGEVRLHVQERDRAIMAFAALRGEDVAA
jgi:hypothetical protein